jgi:hypothetical protein
VKDLARDQAMGRSPVFDSARSSIMQAKLVIASHEAAAASRAAAKWTRWLAFANAALAAATVALAVVAALEG